MTEKRPKTRVRRKPNSGPEEMDSGCASLFRCANLDSHPAPRGSTHTRDDAPAHVRELVVADGAELFLLLPLLRSLLCPLRPLSLLRLRVFACKGVSTVSFSSKGVENKYLYIQGVYRAEPPLRSPPQGQPQQARRDVSPPAVTRQGKKKTRRSPTPRKTPVMSVPVRRQYVTRLTLTPASMLRPNRPNRPRQRHAYVLLRDEHGWAKYMYNSAAVRQNCWLTRPHPGLMDSDIAA